MQKIKLEITVGRRKAAVARISVVKGKGKVTINSRSPLDYFKRESLVMMMEQPFKLVDFDEKYDFSTFVRDHSWMLLEYQCA